MFALLFLAHHSLSTRYRYLNKWTLEENSDLYHIKDSRPTFIRLLSNFGSRTKYLDELWTNASDLFPYVNFVTVYCDENNNICSHIGSKNNNPLHCLIQPERTECIKESIINYNNIIQNSEIFIDTIKNHAKINPFLQSAFKLTPSNSNMFYQKYNYSIFVLYNLKKSDQIPFLNAWLDFAAKNHNDDQGFGFLDCSNYQHECKKWSHSPDVSSPKAIIHSKMNGKYEILDKFTNININEKLIQIYFSSAIEQLKKQNESSTTIKHIKESGNTMCGKNLNTTIIGSTLYITGFGSMYDYGLFKGTPPWSSHGIKSAIFDDGVWTIGEYAFWNEYELTTVTLNEDIHSISNYAFCNCYKLESINLPENMTSLGPGAFMDCSHLSKIILPKNLKYCYIANFEGCSNLMSINIPDIFTKISSRMFYCCSHLTTLTLPPSIVSINSNAFFRCYRLKSINLPENLTEIGNEAFCNCISLNPLTLPNKLVSLGEGAFYGCKFTSYEIPDHVESVGSALFSTCMQLKTVKLPKGLSAISFRLFSLCIELVSVDIPDSVTVIEEYAFYQCFKLKSLKIPNNVSIIQESAFMECTSLETIRLPDNLEKIFDSVFLGDIELKSVMFSSNIKSLERIDKSTFKDCIKLESIVLPQNVLLIGEEAFCRCEKLTDVQLPENIYEIRYSAFYSCMSLKSITLPNSLLEIHSCCFQNCFELETIKFKLSPSKIKGYAFANCYKLTSISLPYRLNSIPSKLFFGCINLVSISIGSYLDYVANDAFENVSKLEKFEALFTDDDSSDFKIVDGVLFNNNNLCTYPPGKRDTSYTAPDFIESIYSGAFYNCNFLETITLGPNFREYNSNSFYLCSNLKSINIKSSLYFTIENGALCNSSDLVFYPPAKEDKSFTFPDYVTKIKTYAFSNCINLKTVNINSKVDTIEEYAFYECVNLETIQFDVAQQNISINQYAFHFALDL